jgi:hypothetical protein
MRYSDLISLYFERSNAIQSYWTVYVVAIGGLLAVAALRREPDVVAAMLASVLYCAFAYKNLGAIYDVSMNRFATLDAIHNFEMSAVDHPQAAEIQNFRQLIEPTLTPPAYDGVRNFHIACDAMTILTLWALQWRRLRHRREEGLQVRSA